MSLKNGNFMLKITLSIVDNFYHFKIAFMCQIRLLISKCRCTCKMYFFFQISFTYYLLLFSWFYKIYILWYTLVIKRLFYCSCTHLNTNQIVLFYFKAWYSNFNHSQKSISLNTLGKYLQRGTAKKSIRSLYLYQLIWSGSTNAISVLQQTSLIKTNLKIELWLLGLKRKRLFRITCMYNIFLSQYMLVEFY